MLDVVLDHLEEPRTRTERPHMRVSLVDIDAGDILDHRVGETIAARKRIIAEAGPVDHGRTVHFRQLADEDL